jgi:hypothetical protein
MAAYGAGDQITGAPGTTDNLPNFVGELFRLSPIDTPLLSLIGSLTGGKGIAAPIWTWQDTLHRAPALQAIDEGADATFDEQKRNERSNVTAIHQYGVELTYTKQAATGLLGTIGTTPDVSAANILGTQPVQNEMAWQLQIKLEQAAMDVEVMFLTGTLASPATTGARQSQGILGAISADTTTTHSGTQLADASVVNDLSKKLYDNGAPQRSMILMGESLCKVELGTAYQDGGNLQPRSFNEFGVNITQLHTEFGSYNYVLNRHMDDDTLVLLDLSVMAPCFLATPGKGHFFMEPLSKAGSYDRHQLYGDIGLEYGPAGWHAKAASLHTA